MLIDCMRIDDDLEPLFSEIDIVSRRVGVFEDWVGWYSSVSYIQSDAAEGMAVVAFGELVRTWTRTSLSGRTSRKADLARKPCSLSARQTF